MEADTNWMRMIASDCEATANTVRQLLGPADTTVDMLKRGAPGWAFTGSLEEMMRRWEDLNKLLCDELSEAAENIRFNASSHDGNENFITETWHNLFG
jgi:hypothetical protein